MAKTCGRLRPTDLATARAAYADANPHGGAHRRLTWIGRALRPADAAKVMRAAVPEGYNNFDANKVGTTLKKYAVCVRFGREGSPAVYVYGDPATLNKISGVAKRQLAADEARRCVSVRVTPAEARYRSAESPVSIACTHTGRGGTAPKGGKARWLRLWWD